MLLSSPERAPDLGTKPSPSPRYPLQLHVANARLPARRHSPKRECFGRRLPTCKSAYARTRRGLSCHGRPLRSWPSLPSRSLRPRPRSMPYDEPWRTPTQAYSPECVEGRFSELRMQDRALVRSYGARNRWLSQSRTREASPYLVVLDRYAGRRIGPESSGTRFRSFTVNK